MNLIVHPLLKKFLGEHWRILQYSTVPLWQVLRAEPLLVEKKSAQREHSGVAHAPQIEKVWCVMFWKTFLTYSLRVDFFYAELINCTG